MDAPKLMMLGVAALGGYALYRMTQASPSVPGDEPKPAPGPSPAPSPAVPALVPGAKNLPEGSALVLLDDPLSLKQNQYYRGRMEMPLDGVPPFDATAGVNVLVESLTGLGFADVKFYMKASELPQTGYKWPMSSAKDPTPNTRWFQARWNAPSIKVPRPPAIVLMWVTPSPELVARTLATPPATTAGMVFAG